MYENKLFRTLVFYIEACESGSMFDGLLSSNINILAITAANPSQSSYACYWDKDICAYLGDEFSVSWMENSDGFEIVMNETIQDQYKIVVNETTLSQVCAYGDTSMLNLSLSEYLTYNETAPTATCPRRVPYKKISQPRTSRSVMDSRDVKLDYLFRQYARIDLKRHTRQTIKNELQQELMQQFLLEQTFGKYTPPRDDGCYQNQRIDMECLRSEINNFTRIYGRLTDTGMKYIRKFAKRCFN
jgi:legumain